MVGYLLAGEFIESFARNGLGCNCPDDVFERIDNGMAEHAGVEYQRIGVGGRLLIYLVLAGRGSPAGMAVDLMAEGRRERHAQGFNRVRLVLVGRLPDQERLAVEAAVAGLVGDDAKAHLHLVDDLSGYAG
ncbi:MAG: hypothetical protein ABW149_12050 [Sedimenticola sp.]